MERSFSRLESIRLKQETLLGDSMSSVFWGVGRNEANRFSDLLDHIESSFISSDGELDDDLVISMFFKN